MLQLYLPPLNEEAYQIVSKYINNRLIGLMVDVIDELAFPVNFGEGFSEEDWSKPAEEIYDFTALAENPEFAGEIADMLLPENFPVEKASYEFFSLYRLLKAKKEYKPALPMEYILYHLIQRGIGEVEFINELEEEGAFDDLDEVYDEDDEEMKSLFTKEDLDEEVTTIERIPEPDRSIVLKSLKETCEPDEDPEELLVWLEDLREYEAICFEDTDCLFLDQMEEDELYQSDMAKLMGIEDRPDKHTVDMSMNGQPIKLDMRLAPWDMEEESE